MYAQAALLHAEKMVGQWIVGIIMHYSPANKQAPESKKSSVQTHNSLEHSSTTTHTQLLGHMTSQNTGRHIQCSCSDTTCLLTNSSPLKLGRFY